MKPREKRPAREVQPLDNNRRRGIYVAQNGRHGPLTAKQAKRVRKAGNRALLAAAVFDNAGEPLAVA